MSLLGKVCKGVEQQWDLGARRTSEQKELPTGMGISVGGSEKAACPENTSASWIAKVRGSKMRHETRDIQRQCKSLKIRLRSLFSMQWPLPSLLKEAVLCFWMLIYSAYSSAQRFIFSVCPNYEKTIRHRGASFQNWAMHSYSVDQICQLFQA